MRCQSCGRELSGNEKFCNGCGCPVNAYPDNNPYYNKGYQPNSNNQQYNSYNQGNNSSKNNNKLIIIVSVIAVALIAVAIILFVCLSSSDDESTNENTKNNSSSNNNPISVNTNEDYSKYIKYELEKFNGEDWIKIENTSNKSLSGKVVIKFYDKDKKPLGNDTVFLSCLDNGVVLYDRVYSSSEYDSYEVEVEAEESYFVSLIDEKFDIVDNDVDGDIYVEVRNNTSHNLGGITLLIKYYKNGKVVAMDSDWKSNVASKKSASFSFYVPYDENYKNISYDEIKYEIVEVYYSDYDE